MKIFISLLLTICCLQVGLALSKVHAVGLGAACQVTGATTSAFCQDQSGANRLSGPTGVIVTGANLLSFIAGIAAVIVITIAGLQYILSGGDSSKVNDAKNMILYALIGLVVIALAQVIIRVILSKL